MRLALAVHRVVEDRDETVRSMLEMIQDASQAGAELVLFSEAAPTGLILEHVPAKDLACGEPVGGRSTRIMADAASRWGIWIGYGMLERDGDRLYDSALLLDDRGTVRLHYRRIDPHWLRRDADPAVYRQGDKLPTVSTPFGRCAFLICGDVFNDDVVDHVRHSGLELLLVPIARGFDEDAPDAAGWDKEVDAYGQQFRDIGAAGLVVNHLSYGSEPCLGGAFAVSDSGGLIDRLPTGVSGLLVVDL